MTYSTYLSRTLGRYLMDGILPGLHIIQDTRSEAFAVHHGTINKQIETLTDPTQQYQVFFGGNAQDVYNPYSINALTARSPDTVHIFKPYPGIATDERIETLQPLIEEGYQRVKTLIEDNQIPVHQITLYGLSIGGGIAAAVAKRLHDEGYCVNVTIDRSFSSLSAVLPALLDGLPRPYQAYLPLATSIVSFTALGIALGTAIAGLIQHLNFMHTVLPEWLNTAVDINASLTGALISITAAIVGATLGFVLGLCLSVQLFWTDTPVHMPFEFAARALLNTTTGELNSVNHIQAVLTHETHGHVRVINAAEDEVIRPPAALNTALGLPSHQNRRIKNPALQENFSSFWYKNTNHNDDLNTYNIDESLTYPLAAACA